jgi:hypothetical protein
MTFRFYLLGRVYYYLLCLYAPLLIYLASLVGVSDSASVERDVQMFVCWTHSFWASELAQASFLGQRKDGIT